MNKKLVYEYELMKYHANTQIHIGNLKYAMELNNIDSYFKLHEIVIEKMKIVNNEIKKSNPERNICPCLEYKQFKRYIDNKAINPPISFYYSLSKTLNVSINFLLGREFTIKPIFSNELIELFSFKAINKMILDPNIANTLNLIFESTNLKEIAHQLFKFFYFFYYPVFTDSDKINYKLKYVNSKVLYREIYDWNPTLSYENYFDNLEKFESVNAYLTHIEREDMEKSFSLIASEYLNTIGKSIIYSPIETNRKNLPDLSRAEKIDDALASFKTKPLKKEIGKICNFSKNTLSRIINQKESFSAKTKNVLNLCDTLNISIDYFLGTGDTKEPYDYFSLGFSKLAIKNLTKNKCISPAIIYMAFDPIIVSDELPLFLDLIQQISKFNIICKNIRTLKKLSSDFPFSEVSNLDESNFIGDMDLYNYLGLHNNYILKNNFFRNNFFGNNIFINKCSNLLMKIKENDKFIQEELQNHYEKMIDKSNSEEQTSTEKSNDFSDYLPF